MTDSTHSLPAPRFLDPKTPPKLVTLVIVAAIAALSLNIFLPSMPAIADHFGASYAQIQFMLSGYLFVTGVLQLFIGPVSDRYGRRPVQIVSLIIFIAASIACVYAPTTAALLTARMVQAVIVASFVVSRAAVRDIFPGNHAAAMLGYIAMGMSVAPMLAPTLGGFLQESFGWTSSFWAMAAIGVFVLVLVLRDMGETNHTPSISMTQQMKSYPVLLKSRRFWGYAITTAFASGCFFTFLGGAPFVGTVVYGLSPAQVGLYFIFTPAGYFLGNLISSQFSVRLGITRMILIGSLLLMGGMVAATLTMASGVTHPLGFYAFTVCIGLGNGMVIPNGSAGMMNIDPRLAGTAAGLGGALMTFGGAILSSVVVSLLTAERGAYPLALCIFLSGLISLIGGLYAAKIETQITTTRP